MGFAAIMPSTRRAVADLKARAGAARDAGRFAEAARLFEEAVRLQPNNARLRIQCGHMHKEAGDLAQAEAHYLLARQRLPRDADLSLQLGHFYKVAGRLAEAEHAYSRAAALKPGWAVPLAELTHLKDRGWIGDAAAAPPSADPPAPGEWRYGDDAAALRRAATIDRLVPELVPRKPQDLLHAHHQLIDVRRLGRREPGYWGICRTLRGIEAIRGFCISEKPIVELQVIVNGLTIHRGPIKGGYILKFEEDKARRKKYVFNVWLDFSPFAHGLHEIELRLLDADDETRSFHERVVIAAPVAEADYPGSDALVSPVPGDDRPIERQIRTRPSMVRPAKRALFPDGVRNVLVMRTDQLGDLVASIPALMRLRELVPDANIVGLLTAANADLARTLGLFDEVIVADFPDDRTERRRLMPLATQEELRARLAPYRFDIAIDLAQASVSRDLLRLAGAKFTFGTGGEDWPWLSADVMFHTHDRWNAMDNTPHSSKVLAVVETLGALLKTTAPVIRRPDLSRGLLAEHGIAPDDRFAVLHAGARVEFSRWPHYPALAALLLDQSDLKIVMMTEEEGFRAKLPPELTGSDRFQLIDRRLSFDMFDAFISFATVVVGNDSGPKHLAALRGTNVVTLFTARINWSEWGQENVGSIISRRVPCAGCAIFHDAEECGKEFACIVDIAPREVLDAVMAYV